MRTHDPTCEIWRVNSDLIDLHKLFSFIMKILNSSDYLSRDFVPERYANQLDSTNNLVYYHQALIYLHHGQFEQAENRINLIINIKQSPSFIINQLQSICLLDPSLWLLKSIIKLMKYKSNDYSDSILNEALDDACYAEQLIVPKLMNELTSWPHLHYTKGQILYKLKDYIKADEEFTKALSLLPSNKYIYQIRCKCREEMYRTGLSNSYENALIDYRLSLLANDVTNQ
ncbi:unnamed protein product [Schistosoma curassoni]|nr:unnamed protein product [Schistosoma curassoni]